MALQSRQDQVEEDRRALRRAEAAALALLLRWRRKPIRGIGQSPATLLAPAAAASVRAPLVLLRSASRSVGAQVLVDDLAGLGIEAAIRAPTITELLADQIRASRAANGVERTWTRAAHEPRADAASAQGATIRRTAVTESSEAFNRRDQIVIVSAEDAALLVKVWDSQLEACPACILRDGERTQYGEPFQGAQPGGMHPHCACLWHVERAGQNRAVSQVPAGAPQRTSVAPPPPKAVPTRPQGPPATPKTAAAGYLVEKHTPEAARAYERMLESRVIPEAVRNLPAQRGFLESLQRGNVSAASLQHAREGMREGSFESVRRAFAGKADPTAIATGRALPPGERRPLPPIQIGAYPRDGISLVDGRHRMQVARESGATHIRADIILYDNEGNHVWRGLRNIPLPR